MPKNLNFFETLSIYFISSKVSLNYFISHQDLYSYNSKNKNDEFTCKYLDFQKYYFEIAMNY